jgi:aspartyl-tRNA(Asn)/glutamyl-tRNA(Gln) amidotransferase subunit B
MSFDEWEVVIGLEIHAQLNTRSKIFSGASTEFGAEPNTQTSIVDLGFPGVLPVVNEAVFKKAVAFGLGVNGKINTTSVFDRKNYFYPDLPKGYQITQLSQPIVEHGEVEITLSDGSSKIIHLTRAHLEEDAGKSVHDEFHDQTGIDLNRAGTPLLEIVSEPEIRSAQEAVAYARKIHQIITSLDVSDGNMSQGSMRCDANVSVRKKGDEELGTRTETKNVNSFRFLEAAINYEVERQIAVLESGGRVIQETRLYDPDKDETRSMRSKETAMDYRYFPEPDLLPVVIDEAYIEDVRQNLPELPEVRAARYVTDLGLSEADATVLAADAKVARYFEAILANTDDAKLTNNWVRVELLARLNRDEIELDQAPLTPDALSHLIMRIKDNTISGKIAKQIFDALWSGEAKDVDGYIEAKNLGQVSDDSALEPLIDKIIADNPKQVAQYRDGKTKLLGFFVGQVMKETGGKANPAQVNQLLTGKLEG